jgi:acyl-CoA thioester hydrolase
VTPGTLPLPALVFLLVHETLIHVRWGELDPYHHVNHATYLSYLEHARIAALESIGWGMDEIASTGHQVVVAKIDIQFRLPALGGNELVVETSIEDLRGASSIWRQRVVRGGDVILEAMVTAACTNHEGRPSRTPPRFQEALETFRDAS